MQTMSGAGFAGEMMLVMMRPDSGLTYLFAALFMWITMMVAMMVPAVIPMASIYRGMCKGKAVEMLTLVFALSYLVAWSLFAIVAAVLQQWLHLNGWLGGMTLEAGARLSAALFVLAGLWQFTPMKEACLSRCQNPLTFIMNHWREGYSGASNLGFRHGLYCVGCCWALMMLMFAGGAMSVWAMAALAALILVERLLPAKVVYTRIPGFAMILLGLWLASG